MNTPDMPRPETERRYLIRWWSGEIVERVLAAYGQSAPRLDMADEIDADPEAFPEITDYDPDRTAHNWYQLFGAWLYANYPHSCYPAGRPYHHAPPHDLAVAIRTLIELERVEVEESRRADSDRDSDRDSDSDRDWTACS